MEEQMISIIDRYLGGTASGDEAEQIHVWLANADASPSPLSSLSPHELNCISGNMFSVITDALDTLYNEG